MVWMKRHRGWVLALAGLAGLIAASVVLALATDSESAVFDPAEVDTAGLDGRKLFAASCARCHGADGGGTTTGPPLVDPLYRPGHHPDAAFIAAVRSGVRSHHWDFGNMPAIPDLTDREVAAIIEFVRDAQARADIR